MMKDPFEADRTIREGHPPLLKWSVIPLRIYGTFRMIPGFDVNGTCEDIPIPIALASSAFDPVSA